MIRRAVAAGCLLLAAGSSARAMPLTVRLRLVVRSRVPETILEPALAEAAHVWARYDVLVQTVETGAATATGEDALALTVVIDDNATPAEGDDGLGAIRFASDGTPLPEVSIHYDRVRRLALASQVLGMDASHAPQRLRDHAVGLALGRSLAHEIGHFVLRWTHHASRGLMRPQQGASALTAADPNAFTLTDSEVERLRIVLAARGEMLVRSAALDVDAADGRHPPN